MSTGAVLDPVLLYPVSGFVNFQHLSFSGTHIPFTMKVYTGVSPWFTTCSVTCPYPRQLTHAFASRSRLRSVSRHHGLQGPVEHTCGHGMNSGYAYPSSLFPFGKNCTIARYEIYTIVGSLGKRARNVSRRGTGHGVRRACAKSPW